MAENEIIEGLAILANAFADDAPTRNAGAAIRNVTQYAYRVELA